MPGKKATKNINIDETILILRQYVRFLLIQFKQMLRELPEDNNLTNENLAAVFRRLWMMNTMMESILGDDAVTHSEPRHFNESSIDLKSALKKVYKTMRKLNSLLRYEFNFDT